MPRLIISWSLGNIDPADDVAYCSLLVFRTGHTVLWGVGLRAKEHAAWEVILLALQLDQSDKVGPGRVLLLRKCCSSFGLIVCNEEDAYVAGYCLELLIK